MLLNRYEVESCSDRVTHYGIRTVTGSAHKLSDRVTRVYTEHGKKEKKKQSGELTRATVPFRDHDQETSRVVSNEEEFDTHVSLLGQRTLFSSLEWSTKVWNDVSGRSLVP